ncbi:MAG: hypothetical protein KBD23_02965, partial [Gammaproteobacteria bacterium]|nr:hypothetical protein [Gammaproteobacteria bacterium]
ATLLLQDMTARMQANAAEFWAGASSGYLSPSPANQATCYSSTGAFCTSNLMALNDLWEWKGLISSSFPSAMAAVGLVCLDAGTATLPVVSPTCGTLSVTYPLVFSVKIYWKSTPGAATYDQVQVGRVEAPLLRAPGYPYPNNGSAPNT